MRAQIGKALGAEWRGMSDKDKEKYGGHFAGAPAAAGGLFGGAPAAAGGGLFGGAPEEPKARGEKPLTGFMKFSAERRPTLKAEQPDLTFGGVRLTVVPHAPSRLP